MSAPKQVVAAAEEKARALRLELDDLESWLTAQQAPQAAIAPPTAHRKAPAKKVAQKGKQAPKKGIVWTAAKRAAHRRKMKAIWAERKAKAVAAEE
jgi:hypothetical protein